jgi:hypothetical protein
MVGWQVALVAVAVIFIAFLLFQMRPGSDGRRTLGADVKAARDRAHGATTPRARAEALVEAGTLAVQGGARWTAAAGFFLRAMNADPTWPDAVTQLAAVFHRRRPRLLEKILWRRLSHLPWDDAHRAALHAVTEALGDLYERERRDAAKLAVFRKLSRTFAA